MRYAIVSDIHANLQAWQAVMADCSGESVDHVICLGDVVGYGPAPAETLAAVRKAACALALGNHDAAAIGTLDPERFIEFAQKTSKRAALALPEEAKDFLKGCPLILLGEGFAATHGSFLLPDEYYYVVTERDAELAFKVQPERVLFVGHTHHPCIFERNEKTGEITKLPPEDFKLKEGFRYLVNPGSVGFPRESDIRAAYVIFDSFADEVVFRRVAYDLKLFRTAVIRNGYHQADYWFLNKKMPGKQDELSFSYRPLPGLDQNRGAPSVRAVDFEPRRNTHRLAFFTLLAGLLLLTGLCLLVLLSLPNKASRSILPETEPSAATARLVNTAGGSILPLWRKGETSGWNPAFTHPTGQHIVFEESPPGIRLTNTNPEGVIRLETVLLDVGKLQTNALQLSGAAIFSEKANLRLLLQTTCYALRGEDVTELERVETVLDGAEKTPLEPRKITLPPGTRFIRFAISARASGEVLLEELALVPVLNEHGDDFE